MKVPLSVEPLISAQSDAILSRLYDQYLSFLESSEFGSPSASSSKLTETPKETKKKKAYKDLPEIKFTEDDTKMLSYMSEVLYGLERCSVLDQRCDQCKNRRVPCISSSKGKKCKTCQKSGGKCSHGTKRCELERGRASKFRRRRRT